MTPRNAADRVKTDRRGAMKLARLARAGELQAIYVPDALDAAMRDLVRAREDAVIMQRQARQRLQALLLRNEIRYVGKTAWTQAHRCWISGLKLPNDERDWRSARTLARFDFAKILALFIFLRRETAARRSHQPCEGRD